MGGRLRENLFLLTILAALILACSIYLLSSNLTAEASKQEEIKIIPDVFSGKWQNPGAALSQDLAELASFVEFNQENSAYPYFGENTTSTQEAILEFSNFGLADKAEEKKITNVQLRLSLAGKGTQGNRLLIEYSYQDAWQNLAEFNLEKEISNALNQGYFLYGLPILESWSDLENLKFRFRYQQQAAGGKQQVYLDAIWLEVDYEEMKVSGPAAVSLGKKAILPQIKGKKNFRSNEEAVFEVAGGDTQAGEWKVKHSYIVNPEGEETEVNLDVRGNLVWIKKSRSFRPGKYYLKLEIEKDGQTYNLEREFTWGVLAINTSKSIYLPGEIAYLQMAALRDDGHTICDANLELEVTSPEGQISFPEVQRSGQCSGNNVTDKPDYFAYYPVSGAGDYQMKLTNLDNGYEITDSFEVKESVPFDVERIGPTRIYPPAVYEMTLKIKLNQGFQGQVVEQVPARFEVVEADQTQIDTQINAENISVNPRLDQRESASNIIGGETKRIIWNVAWQVGEEYELRYQFDAPDISPYLYLLGPLEFHD